MCIWMLRGSTFHVLFCETHTRQRRRRRRQARGDVAILAVWGIKRCRACTEVRRGHRPPSHTNPIKLRHAGITENACIYVSRSRSLFCGPSFRMRQHSATHKQLVATNTCYPAALAAATAFIGLMSRLTTRARRHLSLSLSTSIVIFSCKGKHPNLLSPEQRLA